MKKLLFGLMVAIAATACNNDNEVEAPKVFHLDPLATINLKMAKQPSKVKSFISKEQSHLSALEIVKQTTVLQITMSDGTVGCRGFDVLQRDTTATNPMLKMWATDIIQEEQKTDGTPTGVIYLVKEFLESKDNILLRIPDIYHRDTIAYIPNSVLREAETKIKVLFETRDYEAIYKLFNDAYTFIPITGAEWRAMKAEGKN